MKTITITLKPAKVRNAYCAILTRTSKFDSRLKRERTRSTKNRKAIQYANY